MPPIKDLKITAALGTVFANGVAQTPQHGSDREALEHAARLLDQSPQPVVEYFPGKVRFTATRTTDTAPPVAPPSLYPNQPLGMTAYVDNDMGILYASWNSKGQLVPSTRSGGSANRANWVVGDDDLTGTKPFGGIFKEWLVGAHPKIGYMSVWMYLSSNFQFNTSTTKMGPWMGMVGESPNTSATLIVASGSGYPRIAQQYPQTVNFEDVPQSQWPRGQWLQVEMLMDTNAGTIKMWINGTLRINASGVSVSQNGISGIRLDPYWGGQNGGTWAVNGYIDYDHVYFSGKDA